MIIFYVIFMGKINLLTRDGGETDDQKINKCEEAAEDQ